MMVSHAESQPPSLADLDELGELYAGIESLTDRAEKLRAKLNLPNGVVTGKEFQIAIEKRRVLDAQRLEALMGERWYREHIRAISGEKITVKVKKLAKAQ